MVVRECCLYLTAIHNRFIEFLNSSFFWEIDHVFFYTFRPDIVIALAGNKSDLANRRAVEYEEANGYAEENGLLFMETSAKNANNVNEIFLAIVRKLPRDADGAGGANATGGQRLHAAGQNGAEGGKKACCNR